MTDHPSSAEVDRNYAAFRSRLPELLETHGGKFAVLHNGEIIEFFDTLSDAVRCGRGRFGDINNFSIQEVIASPATLGFYAYAMCADTVQPNRSGS